MAELTPKQLEKDVKRINERINEVVKLLGSDSEAYHHYVSKLKSLLPSQYVRVDKDGLYKIARKKELYQRSNEENIQRAFEQILKTPTAGNIKKKAKEVIKAERKKKKDQGAESLPFPIEKIPDEVGVGNGAIIRQPSRPDVITKKDIEEFAKMIDKVERFVSDNNDMFYVVYEDKSFNDIIHKSGKKSYSELNQLIDAYQSQKYNETASIFDDIDF